MLTLNKICLSLAPFAYLIYVLFGNPIIDPVHQLLVASGKAIVFSLTILLSIAFLPKRFKIGRARKAVGLSVFFYSTIHFLTWFADSLSTFEFNLNNFTVAGLGSYFILFLLATTSNKFSQRKLKKNWKRLHRGVYLATALGFFHIYLHEKADIQFYLYFFIPILVFETTRFIKNNPRKFFTFVEK